MAYLLGQRWCVLGEARKPGCRRWFAYGLDVQFRLWRCLLHLPATVGGIYLAWNAPK